MARTRDLLFRIFYSTSFTIVFLVLIAMICIAPADKLYESYKRRRIVDIIIIAAAWVLTGLVAAFLYGTRLYTNRAIIRDIPKTFLPIEREDLPGRNAHRAIQETFARSAVIAYQAKPRAKRIEVELEGAGERMLAVSKQMKMHHHQHNFTLREQALLAPKWDVVAHPGWQSPASTEMPGLEYHKVADELIDLVEAKAVSLAPRDPLATPTAESDDEDGNPLPRTPDPRFVELLARPAGIGMRGYLAQLAELGVLPDSDLTDDFLSAYEHSRYSGKPLSEHEFQNLMRLFAELLRCMQPMEADLLDFGSDDEDDRRSSGKGKAVAANGTIANGHPRTPKATASSSSSQKSEYASSVLVHSALMDQPDSTSEANNTYSSPTNSTTSLPRSSQQPLPTFTTSRSNRPPLSHTNTRSTSHSNASFHSAASARSGRSDGSQRSVIRLVQDHAGNRRVGGMPYEIDVRGFGEGR